MGCTSLISALVRSEVTAVLSVQLILMPSILLGGFIKPHYQLADSDLLRNLSLINPVRWVFQAASSALNLPSLFQESPPLAPALLLIGMTAVLLGLLGVRLRFR